MWTPRGGVKITFNNFINFEIFSQVRGSKLPWSSSVLNLKHTMDPPLSRLFHQLYLKCSPLYCRGRQRILHFCKTSRGEKNKRHIQFLYVQFLSWIWLNFFFFFSWGIFGYSHAQNIKHESCSMYRMNRGFEYFVCSEVKWWSAILPVKLLKINSKLPHLYLLPGLHLGDNTQKIHFETFP